MNNQQILKALHLWNNKDNNEYASHLQKICKLLKDLKALPGFSYTITPHTKKGFFTNDPLKRFATFIVAPPACLDRIKRMEFVKSPEHYIIDNVFDFQHFTFVHSAGSYSIDVPINNEFYNYFMFLVDANFTPIATPENNVVATEEIINVTLPYSFKEKIKLAVPYCSKDTLRPAMMGVCLHLSPNGYGRICATDGHRLFYSTIAPYKKEKYIGLEGLFSIPLPIIKEYLKVKGKNPVHFVLYADNTFLLNGIKGKLSEGNYPDYTQVIPNEYPYSVEFLKDRFIQKINTVLPAANKTSRQIKISLNGDIKFSAQDIDFSYDANDQMEYIHSTVPDMDIAFNGKLLLDCLASIPGDYVKMNINGPTKSVTIEAADPIHKNKAIAPGKSLLMPLMIGA